MNAIGSSIKNADRANKRNKLPVFLHLTAYGVKSSYKHMGAYSSPVLMVHLGGVFDVAIQDNFYNYKLLYKVEEI